MRNGVSQQTCLKRGKSKDGPVHDVATAGLRVLACHHRQTPEPTVSVKKNKPVRPVFFQNSCYRKVVIIAGRGWRTLSRLYNLTLQLPHASIAKTYPAVYS